MSPTIGLLTLDTNLSDVPGCAGSDRTYRHRMLRETMKGVSVASLTDPAEGCAGPILEAARALEARGADLIVGDCGFLLRFQALLREELSVPCASSALLLLPLLDALLPRGASIGIITYSARALDRALLEAAGLPSGASRVRTAGVDDRPAWQHLSVPGHSYPYERLREEVLAVTRELVAPPAEIGSILIECTVMPPFAAAIQAQTRLPVLDITLLGELLAASVSRAPFPYPRRLARAAP